MNKVYIPPTQEEIRQVADHWDAVGESVATGKPVPSPHPSSDLLRKVTEFQHRQKALLCSHETVHFAPHRELICGECERPLKFLSDYQIEQFTNPI